LILTKWSSAMNKRHKHRGALIVLTMIIGFMLVIPQVGHATSTGTTFEEIDAYVSDQMGESRIPGVALSIIQDGEVVHARGYGHASNSESVTPDTLFGIGSTGKSITTLAVMQLSEAGAIDLDAPVQQYIPWFRLADAEQSAQLTVRKLLTMTSGVPATAGGEAFRSTEAMSPEAAIRTLSTTEFAHEPGTTFEYVNANFVILGHLIEVVSGQPYEDYVQANIFDPLEMNHTYADVERAREAGFTDGHRYWFGRPVAHEMEQLPALVPAGYIISSVTDLSNYLTMYLNEGTFNGQTILSAEGIAEMQRGVVDAPLGPWADGAAAQYAMGWYKGGPWDGGSVLFHPGSEPTSTAMLLIDHEREIGAAVLMNTATEMPLPGAAGALRELPAGVMSILTGAEPDAVGLGRFYLVFNLIIVGVAAVQIAALVRLSVRISRNAYPVDKGRLAAILQHVPLLWEFGLPIVILLAPGFIGMSWRSVMLWIPDLGAVLVAIATISLVTGLVRSAVLVRFHLMSSRSISDVSGPTTEHPAHTPAT
jgi:CubicO group peptidase (beta-lactamase class C family)